VDAEAEHRHELVEDRDRSGDDRDRDGAGPDAGERVRQRASFHPVEKVRLSPVLRTIPG
jgi:hypothetical protein